jgi:hypothetical protein
LNFASARGASRIFGERLNPPFYTAPPLYRPFSTGQQNLKGRRIAIVILGNSQRPAVHRYIDRVVAAVNAATPGSFVEVDIPFE